MSYLLCEISLLGFLQRRYPGRLFSSCRHLLFIFVSQPTNQPLNFLQRPGQSYRLTWNMRRHQSPHKPPVRNKTMHPLSASFSFIWAKQALLLENFSSATLNLDLLLRLQIWPSRWHKMGNRTVLSVRTPTQLLPHISGDSIYLDARSVYASASCPHILIALHDAKVNPVLLRWRTRSGRKLDANR